MPTLKLTKSSIEALRAGEKDTVYWDTELKGFGVRVHPSGKKTYITQSVDKATGKKRKSTLGATYTLTTAQAREKAKESILSNIRGAERLKVVQSQITLNELWSSFQDGIAHRCKRRTVKEYESSFRNWVSPLIGSRRVIDLTRSDVQKFIDNVMNGERKAVHSEKVKGGVYPALHAKSTLSAMLSFAVDRDIVPQNVCLQVKLKQPKGRDRSLSVEELGRLGGVLDSEKSSVLNPMALAIIKLLLLTGARKTEICSLKWEYLDLDHGIARLPDSKTGAKVIELPPEAVAILRSQLPVTGSPWVFPATRGTSHYQGLQKVWQRVRPDCALTDVKLHDMRHTYGTWAIEIGTDVYTVGKILSHSNVRMTERYIHASRVAAKGASGKIGRRLSDALKCHTIAPQSSEVICDAASGSSVPSRPSLSIAHAQPLLSIPKLLIKPRSDDDVPSELPLEYNRTIGAVVDEVA